MSLIDDLYRDYASAPVDGGHYLTVEFLNPSFNFLGTPGVIRLVSGYAELQATLEASAPQNPSEIVLFAPAPIEIVPPKRDDSGVQDMAIKIDALSFEAMEQLELYAAGPRSAIDVIYRVYLAADLSEPAERMRCVLKNPKISGVGFSAQAVFTDPVNRQFPSAVYTLADFPGLA